MYTKNFHVLSKFSSKPSWFIQLDRPCYISKFSRTIKEIRKVLTLDYQAKVCVYIYCHAQVWTSAPRKPAYKFVNMEVWTYVFSHNMLMKSEAKIRNYNRVQQVRYIVRKYLPRRIVFNDMSVGISFGIYGINSMLSGVVSEAHDLSHASLKSFASNDNSSCRFEDNSLYRCGQSCFKCLLKLLQMAGKIWVCYKPTNRHDRWRSFLHRFLIVYKALELIL